MRLRGGGGIVTSAAVTEAQWLGAVGDLLDACGWSWIHHRPARRANGKWRTPAQGNSAKGFPDIVAVRAPRVLWLELKTTTGRVSPEQRDWIARLCDCGQEAHVIRLPGDWETFVTLTARDPEQLTITANSAARR
jgi:hypothetical protein